jgi:hypothetical protein
VIIVCFRAETRLTVSLRHLHRLPTITVSLRPVVVLWVVGNHPQEEEEEKEKEDGPIGVHSFRGRIF